MVLLAMGLLTGCAGKGVSENEKLNRWLATREQELPPAIYHVQPPDEIQIIAPNIKELHLQKQTVRPDGFVSLNLIGDVYVAGLTPDEIAQLLRKLAKPYYDVNLLEISVQVVEFKSKRIYVFGQVREPGTKPYTGSDTVVRVLAQAQLDDTAWPQKVVVVRPSDDPARRQKVTVDLRRMYQTGNIAGDYLLEAGDIIYVPLSPLSELDQRVKKLLGPLVPAAGVGAAATGGI